MSNYVPFSPATIGVTDESVMSKLTFDDIKDLIGL